MPYIKEDRRPDLNLVNVAQPESAGELNYAITKLVYAYLIREGLSYQHLNDVMGVLECAKQEFYRRVVVPYEKKKCSENGDVYVGLAEQQDESC